MTVAARYDGRGSARKRLASILSGDPSGSGFRPLQHRLTVRSVKNAGTRPVFAGRVFAGQVGL
jgi:hypothetical protein